MADPRPPREERSLPGFLLDFLVGKHPALYSIEELDRMLASPEEDPAHERFLLGEAVKILVSDGLAHRLDQFVFCQPRRRPCRQQAASVTTRSDRELAWYELL
jgi:hypothetical protein